MPRLPAIVTGLLLLLGACKSEAPASDAGPAGPSPAPTPGADPEPTPRHASAGPAPSEAAPSEAAPPEAPGNAQTWTFDDAPTGAPAPGFRPAESHGQGTPATWQVVADATAPTPPNAFGVTESRNDKRTYNIALVEGTSHADVDLSVMVRATGGELNRGGGPIWRVEDADNYYIARWDPVEDNAYLYVMQGGTRTALATVDLKIDHDAWHSLRVVMEGTHMELFIDDQPVLEADDSSLTEPGMIGLWTKSDGATLFDDLSVAAP